MIRKFHLFLHIFGIHWWTPFRFSRWRIPLPGEVGITYRIKVRHCIICKLHNEERDD